jgi:hypothetical protein
MPARACIGVPTAIFKVNGAAQPVSAAADMDHTRILRLPEQRQQASGERKMAEMIAAEL